MPTYEYTCRNCSKIFDILYKSYSGQDETPVCPTCGSSETERMMSVFAAVDSGGEMESGFTGRGPGCGCVSD